MPEKQSLKTCIMGLPKLKPLLLTLWLVLLVALATVNVTTAQLNTRTENLENELAFGQVGVTPVETPQTPTWDAKKVQLKADGTTASGYVPGVARVMLVPYVLDSLNDTSGNYVIANLGTDAPILSGNTLVYGDITMVLDNDWALHWFYKDGFFYYNQVLNPGDTTPALLDHVELSSNANPAKYAGLGIKIEVMASILQAASGAPDVWGVIVNADNSVSPTP